METKNISIPKQMEKALTEEADRTGLSQAEIARTALRNELEV